MLCWWLCLSTAKLHRPALDVYWKSIVAAVLKPTVCLFEVAMDKEAAKSCLHSFLTDMYEHGISFFKSLESIDMRNSDSFDPQDKVAIHNTVQRDVGFDEINNLIYKP